MKRAIHGLILLGAIGGLAYWQLPKPDLLAGMPFSTMVTDRDGRLLHVSRAADDRYRIFVPLEQISPRLIQATLFKEDRHFDSHRGVNPLAVLRAAWMRARGTPRGGASTVTMQVARLRYQLETRTLSGKLRQMFLALALERHYSKRELLEAYFNLAPYGGNVEGIGAAAWLYLGRPPARLAWPEAVSLSVIPQRPARRNPWGDQSDLPAAYSRLYRHLLAAGIVGDSLGENYLFAAKPRTEEAPHWVRQLKGQFPGERLIRSSLSLPAQKLLERQVRRHLAMNARYGIRNAAALLVDTRTLQIVAKVGSADFGNDSIQGQVDGTRSRRSPGSALKPFIYALALDQGIIHPASVLLDAPRKFSDYGPENFDRSFLGPIPAAQALALSRNVPAVELAGKLRHPDLAEFLGYAGIRLKSGGRESGLAIALGAEEVTMEDLARLYAMLANGGELHPLIGKLESAAPVRRLLSPEAAYLTLQMLAGSPSEIGLDRDVSGRIAWKTGTSFGFHDAWTAAVFDHYALVVWVGNFDGEANPRLIGRSAAAPLVFQIISALEQAGFAKLYAFSPPAHANLRQVKLCAISGQMPGPDCRECHSGWIIPGVSPIDACSIHRRVQVAGTSRETFEFWPSNVRTLFAQAGMPRRQPPAESAPMDRMLRRGLPPRILSPNPHQRWMIRSGSAAANWLPLQAAADADVREIYWFANQQFLGTRKVTEPLEWPAASGNWEIVAIDDHGRSASCVVSVEMAER